MCPSDDRQQVVPLERLATGEVQLQHAQVARLVEHPQPILQRQLVRVAGQLERVRAVRTVQRAAVGELSQQAERLRQHA